MTEGGIASQSAKPRETPTSVRRSLVIPVYRNAENIPELTSAIVDLSKRIGPGLEIIFVIDGSPDNSAELAHGRVQDTSLSIDHRFSQPELRLVHRDPHRDGVGAGRPNRRYGRRSPGTTGAGHELFRIALHREGRRGVRSAGGTG